MQFKKLLFFIISITIIISGCGSKNENENEKKEIENKKELVKKAQTKFVLKTQDAQTLTLNIENKEMRIDEIKGKVILVNFFATWCPPCKAEIPHLINLKNKYKDSFEILAINLGNRSGEMTTNEKINDFINEYNINYLVTNVEENYNVSTALGEVRTIPTMFLFDPEGKIVQKYVGVVPAEMMETDIKKALGK